MGAAPVILAVCLASLAACGSGSGDSSAGTGGRGGAGAPGAGSGGTAGGLVSTAGSGGSGGASGTFGSGTGGGTSEGGESGGSAEAGRGGTAGEGAGGTQPLGAICANDTNCSQSDGAAVCCVNTCTLADECSSGPMYLPCESTADCGAYGGGRLCCDAGSGEDVMRFCTKRSGCSGRILP